MNKLNVCIVNWNTKEMLQECLSSVLQQKTSFPFSITIVDNASTDGSAEMVEKRYPKVHIIKNNQNIGMAAGLNQAIKRHDADYYLFLHPDTKLCNDVLQKMVEYMDNSSNVGIAGCKLLYPNGAHFASCHRFPTLRALFLEALQLPKAFAQAFNLHGLYLHTVDYNKLQEIDIIASACLFVRKKCIDNIGLLDIRFTNWMAEWDLASRAKKRSWKVMYVPIAEVIHYEGHSESAKSGLEYKKYSYVIADKMLDSLFLFYEKHYSRISLTVLKSCAVAGMLAKSFFYAPLVVHPKKSREAKERIKHYLRTIMLIICVQRPSHTPQKYQENSSMNSLQ